LACLAVTWGCALKTQGNYMMAYAGGGLDGCLFVLATVGLLLIFFRQGKSWILLLAGFDAAFLVFLKTGLGGGAIGTGLITVALANFPQFSRILINYIVFVSAGLGLPALTYFWLAARVGWHSLLVDNHLFFGHVPWQLMYFNGLRFGFGHPWHSIGLMVASL